MPKVFECFTEIAVLIEADTAEQAKADFLTYIKAEEFSLNDVEAEEVTIN